MLEVQTTASHDHLGAAGPSVQSWNLGTKHIRPPQMLLLTWSPHSLFSPVPFLCSRSLRRCRYPVLCNRFILAPRKMTMLLGTSLVVTQPYQNTTPPLQPLSTGNECVVACANSSWLIKFSNNLGCHIFCRKCDNLNEPLKSTLNTNIVSFQLKWGLTIMAWGK